MKNAVKTIYRARSPFTQLTASRFAAHMPTMTYSVIFWTEALHKERLSMWKIPHYCRPSLSKTDIIWLHNAARYMHSYKTNILILRRTLELVRDEHFWFAKTLGDPVGYFLDGP